MEVKVLTANESLNLDIQDSLSLLVDIQEDVTEVSITARVAKQAKFVLVINQASVSQLHLSTNIEVEDFAQVKFGLLNLAEASMKWDSQIDLKGPYADVDVISGQLCYPNTDKVGAMEILHHSGYTTGNMKHFSVLLDDARYEMVANGHILGKCPEAQSHQATRALTLGQGHDIKVIPLLLIDENRVQASHALTIGQPDVDQLYYLQSRGLTHKQALGLLSVGYFLPVLDLIEDDEVKTALTSQMETKVGLYASH